MPRFEVLLGLLAVALTATVAPSSAAEPHVMHEWINMTLTSTCGNEFIPTNNALTGLKSYNGDLYVTISRWRHGVPVALAKVVQRGQGQPPMLEPYPSCEMQAIGDANALQFVQSFEIDSEGRMWIIDVGRRDLFDLPAYPPVNGIPPKLVIYDMKANKVLRTYTFPDEVASYNASFLNDIVVDEINMFAYISEAGTGSIVVYDYNRNRSRRFTDVSTQREPSVHWVINGVDYGTGNFTIPEDGIALTATVDYLYYNALQGYHLYSIPTSYLRDFNTTDATLSQQVRNHGAKSSPSDGMAFSDNGNLYYGALMENALYEWDPTTPLSSARKIASSVDTMQWPDTFGFDGKGSIVFTTNKLQEFFTYTMKFTPGESANFRIVSLFVNGNSYIDGQKPLAAEASDKRMEL